MGLYIVFEGMEMAGKSTVCKKLGAAIKARVTAEPFNETPESKTFKAKLQNKESGGVFLTTIHKFTEDLEILSHRTNIIVISDEAHRSQINLDQKVKVTQDGVKKSYGFAKYLHDSLPNATYVGFTGTPIDAPLDVFGDVVDSCD